jgi:hypothetical protein
MTRKTDQEILREYLELYERPYPTDKGIEQALLSLVEGCRKDEPRINCGAHLIDYTMICDEDDTMDTFYGPDYFEKYPC